MRALADAAERVRAREAGQIPVIVVHARSYAALLRGHIDKEDTILYPLAERVLPEDVRPKMLQAYRQAESRTTGLRERYQKMVEDYERQVAGQAIIASTARTNPSQ